MELNDLTEEEEEEMRRGRKEEINWSWTCNQRPEHDKKKPKQNCSSFTIYLVIDDKKREIRDE